MKSLGRFVPFNRRRDGDPEHGPRVVALGGGTGLSVLLRGLKERTHRVTAIVTVADDGGSSGRLRDELGMLPPGDIRSCLVALADAEPLMRKLFQYRFNQGKGLEGHTFGNLFIAAMTDITGDFQEALLLSSRVLAVKGRVLPATLEKVVLKARMEDGTVVEGESQIPLRRGRIRRIQVEPRCVPLPETLKALAEADVIVMGPGSLYTSVLPVLLVEGMAEAILASPAVKVYVCNVMTQSGETQGYRASDHVKAIKDHLCIDVVDVAVVNTGPLNLSLMERYTEEGAEPVVPDVEAVKAMGLEVVEGDLVDDGVFLRHDPRKLADAVLGVLSGVRAPTLLNSLRG